MSQKAAVQSSFKFKVDDKEFKVVGFSAREKISAPFEVNLTLASTDEINFEEVLQKGGLLTIDGLDSRRFFNGIISQFQLGSTSGEYLLYKAQLVPALWMLSLKQNCRIIQEMDTKTIVTKVLEDAGIKSDLFEFRLKETYNTREYCVQYRETDLNFISRLLEEEGIFYFFKHSDNDHLMIFGDSSVNYESYAKYSAPDSSGEPPHEVEYNPSSGFYHPTDCVFEFDMARRVHSGHASLMDYNFTKPSQPLYCEEPDAENEHLEIYDYPGEYQDDAVGKRLAKVRLQERSAFKDQAEGTSTCPGLTAGFTFKIMGHDRSDLDVDYLLAGLAHEGRQPQVLEELSADEEGYRYTNTFKAIPADVVFRPSRTTPKARVEGPQTAVVVGPEGEEIYTDEYGRIKVRFHWDRDGAEQQEKSSCWIRVASTFTGKLFGNIYIPRIGQEVLVEFLEGDPDKPLVTGCVYNAANMPPYTLPDEKTKSTMKSNSSIGGEGFNEIRFEDKKGEEQIFVHGERNLDIRVKSDRFQTIGHDMHLVVENESKEHVKKDRHEVVDNNHMEEIGADRNLRVGGNQKGAVDGNQSHKIGGDLDTEIKGNHNEKVSGDFSEKATNIILEANSNITLKVGGSFVAIEASGIKIGTKGKIVLEGTQIDINADATVNIEGTAGATVSSPAQTTVKADGMLSLKSTGIAELKGAMVKIN